MALLVGPYMALSVGPYMALSEKEHLLRDTSSFLTCSVQQIF
jgi:hypothetical protein